MARVSKKEERLLAQFAAMTGKDISELKAVRAASEPYPHASKSMQMEAALHYIRQPQGYTSKQCLECKEWFGTNYAHVGYCSDSCRAKAWERDMKMPWNMNGKTHRELWGGEIPVIISPTVWANLEFITTQMKELKDKGLAQVAGHQEDSEEDLDFLDDLEEDYPDSQELTSFEIQEDSPSNLQTNPPALPFELESFEFDEEVSSFHLD